MLKRIGLFTLITALLLSSMYISGVSASESETVQSGQPIATAQPGESATPIQTQTPIASATSQVTANVESTITPETTSVPEATPVTKNMIIDAYLSIDNFDGRGEKGVSMLGGVANNPGAVVVVTLWDGKEYRGFVEDDGSFKIRFDDVYYPVNTYTATVYVTSVGAKEGSVIAEDSDKEEVMWIFCVLPPPQAYKITQLDAIYTNTRKIKGVNSTNEGDGEAVAEIRGKEYIADVKENKRFVIDIPKLKVGAKVKIYTTSQNIYFGDSKTKIRVVQLQKATAKKIKAKAKSISGTAYAGSKVKIYKDKKLLGKTVSTKKGKYTVAIAKSKLLKKGANLRIVSTAKTKKKTFKSVAYAMVK